MPNSKYNCFTELSDKETYKDTSAPKKTQTKTNKKWIPIFVESLYTIKMVFYT